MNCNRHIQNQVLMICLAAHKCELDRKLCLECLYEHEVKKKDLVPFRTFHEMVEKKLKEFQTQKSIGQTKLNMILKSITFMFQQLQDKMQESIKQIYDLIELQEESYLKILNNNIPTELSNTDLEQLVQILVGKNLDEWIGQKNYYSNKLDMEKKLFEEQAKIFCVNIKKEMEEAIYGITLGYEREEDLYKVLSKIKLIDEQFLKVVLEMFKNEKNMDILTFLFNIGKNKNQDQSSFMLVADVLKNISEIDFNTSNYSTENYEQIRRDLIKQISYDQRIIEFLKFLIYLTVIDERFIQCGSNSLNLLVEMKLDLREQNFENIRIRDTSLVGGNFVRCNFNGSEFDNVDISGINLNQACLFNCKWKNIKIIELNKLDGLLKEAKSVFFSSDGSLVSGRGDNSICLRDSKTQQQKTKLDGHSREVYSVNFSHDGTTLSSGRLRTLSIFGMLQQDNQYYLRVVVAKIFQCNFNLQQFKIKIVWKKIKS